MTRARSAEGDGLDSQTVAPLPLLKRKPTEG